MDERSEENNDPGSESVVTSTKPVPDNYISSSPRTFKAKTGMWHRCDSKVPVVSVVVVSSGLRSTRPPCRSQVTFPDTTFRTDDELARKRTDKRLGTTLRRTVTVTPTPTSPCLLFVLFIYDISFHSLRHFFLFGFIPFIPHDSPTLPHQTRSTSSLQLVFGFLNSVPGTPIDPRTPSLPGLYPTDLRTFLSVLWSH